MSSVRVLSIANSPYSRQPFCHYLSTNNQFLPHMLSRSDVLATARYGGGKCECGSASGVYESAPYMGSLPCELHIAADSQLERLNHPTPLRRWVYSQSYGRIGRKKRRCAFCSSITFVISFTSHSFRGENPCYGRINERYPLTH